LATAILPNDATNQTVTWSSSKSSLATVDSTGKVTGVAAGKTLIIARTADGGLTAECVVTLTECLPPGTKPQQASSIKGNLWRF
jgi:uncharacterized protein YjdB